MDEKILKMRSSFHITVELNENLSPRRLKHFVCIKAADFSSKEHGLFIRRFGSSDRAQMKIKAYIAYFKAYFDQTCLTSKRDGAMFYIGAQASFKPI